jgi:hypothetical protein
MELLVKKIDVINVTFNKAKAYQHPIHNFLEFLRGDFQTLEENFQIHY